MTVTVTLKKAAKHFSGMMADIASDPIAFLTEQHRDVETLFEEFENSGAHAYKTREKIATEIISRLRLHMQLEEKIFYPAVREIDEELVLEAFEEHDVAKQLMKRIEKTDSKDDSFIAKVSVLKHIIMHHVREEEDALFPQIRSELSTDELESLYNKLEKKVYQLN